MNTEKSDKVESNEKLSNTVSANRSVNFLGLEDEKSKSEDKSESKLKPNAKDHVTIKVMKTFPEDGEDEEEDVKDTDKKVAKASFRAHRPSVSISDASSKVKKVPLKDGSSQKINSDGNPLHRIKSEASSIASAASRGLSVSSSNHNGDGGKEINNSFGVYFTHLRYTILAFILNGIYIALLQSLVEENGFVLSIGHIESAGAISFELICLFCFWFTDLSLNNGVSALMGYLLTRETGFSIVGCGFCYSDIFQKFEFASKLSHRSTAKKFLSRLGLLFLTHLLLLILTVFASTSVYSTQTRIEGTSLMCILYSQDTFATDRFFPTITQAMGVAEMIDGTALGLLSTSQFGKSVTHHYFPPQLTDVCLNGATITGQGFASEISTTCQCSADNSALSLKRAGVDDIHLSSVNQLVQLTIPNLSWVTSLSTDYQTSLNFTTVLTGFDICGGSNSSKPALPVCRTVVSNHKYAELEVTYKTDGTPASIAAEKVRLLEEGDQADISWLYNASVNLFGATTSYHYLPPHWPGILILNLRINQSITMDNK